MRRCISSFLFFVSLCLGDAIAQENADTEFGDMVLPPVERIVLYNSGVGQLQHEGVVEGNKRVKLRFGAHDVSDVLKSLVSSDDGGGHVRAIEYQPAPNPEAIAANDIGQPMTIAQLMQSMRGETVVLKTSTNSIRGSIYGVENRKIGSVKREMIVLLGDEGLSAYDLSEFSSINFEKPELKEQLNLALRGVIQSRKANQKELQLLFAGEQKRNIKFAYVVDMPIWRMTYRLVWENDKAI
ncbi:MAG: hypothetical protein AAGA30_21120, partial [Planctomycetota bacterium]